MQKLSVSSRILLYAANLLVIFYLLFPIMAVLQGSLMSEKTLHGDIEALIPPEVTLDNFILILTQGEAREDADLGITSTYMPDNVRAFYRAFLNSLVIAISVTVLTLAMGACSAYSIVRLRIGWTLWLLNGSLLAR